MWPVLAAAGCFLLPAQPGRTCSVPVFRYALDRWPADPYDVVVFHRGPLAPADRAVVKWLKERDIDNPDGANLLVHTVDLDQKVPAPVQTLWDSQKNPELPWLLVRYPRFSRIQQPVWAGKLTMKAAHALVDSPLRKEIAKQIIDGATTVWVLLECDDKDKNEAARTVLTKTLKKMETLIELPDVEMGDAYESAYAQERDKLKVSFPVLPLRRNNPAEQPLVNMLLHSEEDLTTYKEPMVFPIFGRGRALFALVGKGIHEDNISDVCGFVCGACSCEVKQLNPGVDLLIKMNWDKALYPEPEQPVIQLVSPEEDDGEAR